MAQNVVMFHTMSLEASDKSIKLGILGPGQRPLLSGELGTTVMKTGKYTIQNTGESLVIDWPDVTLTVVHKAFEHERQAHKYQVTWMGKKIISGGKLIDTFDMKGAHWYGAAQIKQQTWPIEKWQRKPMAYVAGDSYDDQYGGVQERYWLSSKGVAILVDPEVPLFVAMNDGRDMLLGFMAKDEHPYRNPAKKTLCLKYNIYQALHVRSAHQLLYYEGDFVRPMAIPDERMFRYPIWSTWAKYKKDINQAIILQFAEEITKNGFNSAQLEIDDDWTPRYGDMDFDPKKFPSPAEMMARLREMGYRVTIWVHPFASTFSEASRKDYWVKGSLGGTTTWWNGLGKILDVTNPNAVAWFKASLEYLRQRYQITSFKFDAGEINWLPSSWKTSQEMENPNTYTTTWANLAYESDTELRCQEARVGFRTQHLPIFIRMMDKDSSWTHENGLKTLIPHALTFGIIGYPFVLPDMIGGNAYQSSFPDRELYIRWLEANVFLPSIQFSICPWQYDPRVVSIAKKMMALHEQFADKMIELARESCETGDPIIRPVWWIAPYDENAQSIDSEFLVGNDLLVAPVLEKGATARNIYLPAGTWWDYLRQTHVSGGRWHFNYKANLDELPHFLLQTAVPGLRIPAAEQVKQSEAKSEETPPTEAPPPEGGATSEDHPPTEGGATSEDPPTEGGHTSEALPTTESTDEVESSLAQELRMKLFAKFGKAEENVE